MTSASNIDPSTSQRGTLSKTRPANIPKGAVDKASSLLRKIMLPKDDDKQIWNFIVHVWMAIHEAFKQDAGLKGCLAGRDEFLNNVEKKGKKKFIDSLRAMAKKETQDNAWYELFEDDTLFAFLGFSRCSDPVFRLDVFFTKVQAQEVNPPRTAATEGKQ